MSPPLLLILKGKEDSIYEKYFSSLLSIALFLGGGEGMWTLIDKPAHLTIRVLWVLVSDGNAEAEKSRPRVGIADRKVFARPESFCM